MEKQVGLWNSSMLDRPKRKSKRSKRRRYHSSSYHKYKKEETPREVSAAGKNGAALDSQVLFIDANYKKDVRLGRHNNYDERCGYYNKKIQYCVLCI